MKVVVAYIPVLHEGYRRFIENNARDSNLYLICREFFRDFRPIEKDIRALDINLIKTAIESWGIARQVSILSTQKAEELASSGSVIILPDEDISRMVVDQFF